MIVETLADYILGVKDQHFSVKKRRVNYKIFLRANRQPIFSFRSF